MKKAKRLLSGLICVFMLLSIIPAFADDVPETVEIRFCVGDETLTINGSRTTVEKPYVVGDGVTLVPLRVITEAFGAKVGWEQSTQTVTLEYPGINMSLQIGNPIAEVNGQAVKLLAPPETKPGVTMIPLRFISETFGATVSYDNATSQITVIKQKSQSGDSGLQGAVTTDKIGDSYYNWSMQNPTDMKMDYRSFDGMYTSFSYDDNNYLLVEIDLVGSEYDFNADFADSKTALKNTTLVKADKNITPDGQKFIHLQAKDKEHFLDVRKIVYGEYRYSLYGFFENEKEKVKEQGMQVIESFVTFFERGNTHDLSEVKSGKRTFEREEIGLSLNVPADFYLVSGNDSENEFVFLQNKAEGFVSRIIVNVYSKENNGSALELAQSDYEHNRKLLNEEITNFASAVVTKKYNNFSAYEYSYEIDGYSEKTITRDVFFEKGQYVYNIAVNFEKTSEFDKVANSIINSVQAEVIDFDKVGLLLRNQLEDDGVYKVDVVDATLEVGAAYEHVEANNVTLFNNRISGVTFSYQYVYTNRSASKESAWNEINSIQDQLRKEAGVIEIVSQAKTATFEGRTFALVGVERQTKGERVYNYTYLTTNNGKMYAITVVYPEETYSEYSRSEINKVLKSLKFK